MTLAKPSIINESSQSAAPRCQHRTLKGRCRQLATDSAGTLCFDHARSQCQAKNDFTLLSPLVRTSEDFQSAAGVNESLAVLHNLLAEGRISPRRAAVIAYVDSLILRTLIAGHIGNEEPHVILNMEYSRQNRAASTPDPFDKPASDSAEQTLSRS